MFGAEIINLLPEASEFLNSCFNSTRRPALG
jgi:hypothetical protein